MSHATSLPVAGMPRPVLHTGRLVLRPFTVTDAPTVELLAGDIAVARTVQNIPHPYPEGGAVDWIEAQRELWLEAQRLTLAVTTDDDGLVGACGLRLELAHGHAELGYWIGAPYWGQGYATEAARAVVQFGFETLALRRIFARHFAANPASGAVMRKLGMQHEGLMRSHVERLGVVHDVVVYGLLRSEWER